MRNLARVLLLFGLVVFAVSAAYSQEETGSLVITFKDGRQQSFAVGDIARMEFKPGGKRTALAGKGKFLGKWRVGDGQGNHFYITLDQDGGAKKSIGAAHGTWIVVDGEARISWDDKWHDIIRKVGNKYQKLAIPPDKSFGDEPSNVTEATNTDPRPI